MHPLRLDRYRAVSQPVAESCFQLVQPTHGAIQRLFPLTGVAQVQTGAAAEHRAAELNHTTASIAGGTAEPDTPTTEMHCRSGQRNPGLDISPVLLPKIAPAVTDGQRIVLQYQLDIAKGLAVSEPAQGVYPRSQVCMTLDIMSFF